MSFVIWSNPEEYRSRHLHEAYTLTSTLAGVKFIYEIPGQIKRFVSRPAPRAARSTSPAGSDRGGERRPVAPIGSPPIQPRGARAPVESPWPEWLADRRDSFPD